MPVTGNTSLIASLSIAGIPPFCGFWSKLIIIIASFEAGNYFGAVVCILVSMVTLASFLKVQKFVFLRRLQDCLSHVKEVPLSMAVSMLVLAVLCLAVGLAFVPVLNRLIRPAAESLLNGLGYINLVLGG
jgi:multicomponent Na+:H+ antiporter subunit D